MRTISVDGDGQAPAGPGRPREFDVAHAIDAGIGLIRRVGYEAASLEALTRAMGISRSSFYAAFGSKRGVLLAALEHYSRERLAALAAVAAGPGGLGAALRAIAGVDEDSHGCLMVNCVTELAPSDAEVAAFGARHMARIESIVHGCLPGGVKDGPERDSRARALVALALGVQMLRRSGAAPDGAETLALAVDRLGRSPA